MEDRTLLSTFTVSNTGDSGPGSLRQAIVDSNKTIGATNTIDFKIPGSVVHAIARAGRAMPASTSCSPTRPTSSRPANWAAR